MNWLVVTTLPHFLTLLVSPTPFYSFTVFCSSSLSVFWHLSNEGVNSFLGILDHLLAGLWFITDFYYFTFTNHFSLMFAANTLVFLLNLLVSKLDHQNMISYSVGHSVWHIVSSAKSVFLAYILLKTSYQQTEIA